MSEKGVLQVLFDVRLMLDVLAGGSNAAMGPGGPRGGGGGGGGGGDTAVPGAAAWAVKAAAAAAKSAESATATLVEELDPIDWATYESFLWRNEQRAYQRCAVLLGLFTQLRRLHVAEGTRTPAGAGAGGPVPALPPRLSLIHI